MEIKLLAGIVWLASWGMSLYFYRKLRFSEKNKPFLMAILTMVLMGAASWVMDFNIGLYSAGVLVVGTALLWLLSRNIHQ